MNCFSIELVSCPYPEPKIRIGFFKKQSPRNRPSGNDQERSGHWIKKVNIKKYSIRTSAVATFCNPRSHLALPLIL